MTYQILLGNNLDILPTLPDNSVDSIVTDPPYELGFMGKKWDSSGIAYSVELWQQCLRVLKPGGHLLSFGGTRTWHRVAVAIEDAGFEIRDNIARFYGDSAYCQCDLPQVDWVYGTGEPQTQHSMRPMPDGNLSPTLDSANQQGKVLQSEMQEQGTSSTERAQPKQGAQDGKEPSLEGRSDLQATQGQLLRCEVCEVSSGVSTDGQERRLHHGTQACGCQANRQDADSDRGSKSQGPQPQQQSSEQSGTVPNQRGSQERRGWPICVGCGKPVSTTNAGHMAWVMGSGFPKSLDVSKAIDKKPEATSTIKFKTWLGQQIDQCGKTRKQIDDECGFTACSYSKTDGKDYWSTNHPSQQKWQKMKDVIGLSNDWDWIITDNIQERGFIESTGGLHGGTGNTVGNFTGKQMSNNAISPEAQQWQGWGTALKPAFEPIVVARKPIEGTVANNVLKWGTGGLNIDGSRISGDMTEFYSKTGNPRSGKGHLEGYGATGEFGGDKANPPSPAGRWPANIILDPYTAELLDEQSGITKSGNIKPHAQNHTTLYQGGLAKMSEITGSHQGDTGGASRFFYVAKASKRDRNEGLDELEATRVWDTSRKPENVGSNTPQNRSTEPRKNFHPTVKPTSLMEYLIKLVTPPGGVVLDPFTGSGSTGKAAILQGFDFIGIEMTEEYLPIIEGRLKHAEAMVAEAKEQEKLKENEVLF